MPSAEYNRAMKAVTLYLPDVLLAQIENEARRRKLSKAEVVRQRLGLLPQRGRMSLDTIADLIGSVHGLPSNLSGTAKKHLRSRARA